MQEELLQYADRVAEALDKKAVQLTEKHQWQAVAEVSSSSEEPQSVSR